MNHQPAASLADCQSVKTVLHSIVHLSKHVPIQVSFIAYHLLSDMIAFWAAHPAVYCGIVSVVVPRLNSIRLIEAFSTVVAVS